MNGTDKTSRYDFEAISAGILRLIKEPAYMHKFEQYLDPDRFYQTDKSMRMEGFRRLIQLIKELFHRTGEEKLSTSLVHTRLEEITDTERGVQAKKIFDWMLKDPNVQEKVEDEGVFEVFLEYLKVTEIVKWAGRFSQHYNSGKITEAIREMQDLLPRLEEIKLEDTYIFDVDDIESLLPADDANDASSALYLGGSLIDETIGGIEKQTLTNFITTTSGGKSMMVHHLIRRCIIQNLPVHVTLVEDRPPSFTRRLIAANTGIKIDRLKNYFSQLTSEEWDKIRAAKEKIRELVKVEFRYGESIQVVHKAKKDYDNYCRKHNLPVPVVDIVDYTGHIAYHSFSNDKTHERFRQAYGARKDFALAHDKIAIDFAQTNRAGDQKLQERGNNCLHHSDLASGYDLAQVCDLIISINQDKSQQDLRERTLFISKGRDSAAGGRYTVKEQFDKARWDMDAKQDPESMDEFASNQVSNGNFMQEPKESDEDKAGDNQEKKKNLKPVEDTQL